MAACWGLLFVMQLVTGFNHSIPAAALVKPRVWSEPWRLLTGPMLHGSLMHILMNGLAMLGLGQVLERSASRHLVAPVWLAGALGGALASSILLPGQSSVGASGGIMAMIGFLAVMGWRRKDLLPPGFGKSMVRSVLYIGMLGLLAWQIIDNAGHGGGLVAGALLALVIFPTEPGPLPLEDTPALVVSGWACAAIFVALAVFTGFKLVQGLRIA
jgi:membrane associated rhomboid family serine protease